MKSFLPINIYDAAESQAKIDLSVPVLMGFRPVTYITVGFPTQVMFEGELARYVDHNFEAEVPRLYEKNAEFPPVGYVNAFTSDEKQLFDDIRNAVAAMTLSRFGRSIRPITNLMVQMGPFRAMTHLAERFELNPFTVFEVGPGLGYLGAMLANMGHRYLSFDVTQSLYLWQNRLLAEIAGDELFEMALESSSKGLLNSRVAHMPWWEFIKFLPGTELGTDIVYSNSNLGEMSPLALKHVLHISRHMLEKSSLGLFMYFSTGMCAQNSVESLAVEFAQFGFHKVFDSPFVAYVLNAEKSGDVKAAFENGIPHFNPSGNQVRMAANCVMGLNRTEAPLDVQLASWNYGWVPPFID